MTHAPAGADPAVVGPYLATALADDRWTSCTVELIAGGKSNLTYRVDSPAGSAVLRRPPLGPRAADRARHGARAHGHVGAGRHRRARSRGCCTCAPTRRCSASRSTSWSASRGHVCRDRPAAGLRRLAAQPARGRRGLGRRAAALHDVDPSRSGLGVRRPEGLPRAAGAPLGEAVGRDPHRGPRGARPPSRPTSPPTVPATQRHTVVHGDYRLDNTSSTRRRPVACGRPRLGDVDAGGPARRRRHPARLLVAGPTTPGARDRRARRARGDRCSRASRRGRRSPSATPPAPAWTSRPCPGTPRSPPSSSPSCAPASWPRVRGGAMVGDGFEGIEERIGPLVEIGRTTLADRAV
jgi:hypothetical protein